MINNINFEILVHIFRYDDFRDTLGLGDCSMFMPSFIVGIFAHRTVVLGNSKAYRFYEFG